MPERVQLSRKKGWRMPPNTVSVARPGRWGNPYIVGSYSRPGAVNAFREWVTSSELTLATIRDDLRGKNLACWCPLSLSCHADVLLELANVEPRP